MGAHNYHTTGIGTSLKQIYTDLVQQDAYENGHDGYTGSISQSDGYEVFTPAKSTRWTVSDIDSLLMDAALAPEMGLYDYTQPEDNAAGEKALKKLRLIFPGQADRMVRMSDRPRGQAIAIELTGVRATKVKKAHGKAGSRDKVCAFYGMAKS